MYYIILHVKMGISQFYEGPYSNLTINDTKPYIIQQQSHENIYIDMF